MEPVVLEEEEESVEEKKSKKSKKKSKKSKKQKKSKKRSNSTSSSESEDSEEDDEKCEEKLRERLKQLQAEEKEASMRKKLVENLGKLDSKRNKNKSDNSDDSEGKTRTEHKTVSSSVFILQGFNPLCQCSRYLIIGYYLYFRNETVGILIKMVEMITRVSEIARTAADELIAGHQSPDQKSTTLTTEPQKISVIGAAQSKDVTSERATPMTTTLLRETDDIQESLVHAATIAPDPDHEASFNCSLIV